MITVYAETTFVQAIARQESVDLERVLHAAERRMIRLAIPAISFFEPLYTWRGEQQRRSLMVASMAALARELQEASQHLPVAKALDDTSLMVAKTTDQDRVTLATAMNRVAKHATLLDVSATQLEEGHRLEGFMKQGPGDAVVLASVLSNALATRNESKQQMFLALDNAFDEAGSRQELKNAGVELFRHASGLVGRLRSLKVKIG